jgi:cis-3-alkyl-4-acyloxetan-2-one decarboxylase
MRERLRTRARAARTAKAQSCATPAASDGVGWRYCDRDPRSELRLTKIQTEPNWSFRGLWPYEPRYFETADGRLHYVDEGAPDGQPVVLVHGNPTWGFLYRHFIPPLVDAGYRAIVPDHLGFGRSDKPSDPKLYRIPPHLARLDALLESLDLRGATVVPQDWGGPIGLSWAVAHPERVARLFILNTYAHRPPGRFRCRSH